MAFAFGGLVQERSTLECQETFRDSGNKLGRGVQMSGNLGATVLTSVPCELSLCEDSPSVLAFCACRCICYSLRWSFLMLLMLAGQGSGGQLGVIGRSPFWLFLMGGHHDYHIQAPCQRHRVSFLILAASPGELSELRN